MSKAFTKESDQEPEEPMQEDTISSSVNYMTPYGFDMLQNELRELFNEERPKIVEIVSWAASNGDRSENGDYIYGKKRLREIDRRVRYLTKRLESAKVINPKLQQDLKQVFFGATVTYKKSDGNESTVKLVGTDEADMTQGKISWISPLAKALLRSHIGDIIEFHTPSGVEEVEVLAIQYLL
jgi:transcription elongation factor GreB